MPYTRAAEEMMDSLSKENLRDTLCSILNEDYYDTDFTCGITTSIFLYMLELYNLVFITEKEGRLLLTSYGRELLIKLNSVLY